MYDIAELELEGAVNGKISYPWRRLSGASRVHQQEAHGPSCPAHAAGDVGRPLQGGYLITVNLAFRTPSNYSKLCIGIAIAAGLCKEALVSVPV